MGDSAHTTHHTTPGMTHCHQICTSKYLRNAKKLDVSRQSVLHCIDLRREPGLEISFRMQIWGQWVNQNDPSFRSERTVPRYRIGAADIFLKYSIILCFHRKRFTLNTKIQNTLDFNLVCVVRLFRFFYFSLSKMTLI